MGTEKTNISAEKTAEGASSRPLIRTALLAAAFIATAAVAGIAGYRNGQSAGFSNGYEAGTAESRLSRTERISYEEFKNLQASGKDFYLLIARPTCRYCAIVDDYLSFRDNSDLAAPVYFLSLEADRGTERYDEIKRDVGIDYVPTLRFYKNGGSLYNLNNPLDGSYFDEGATNESRNAIYADMADKIEAFIAGAEGRGEVINEEVKTAESGSMVKANEVK